MLAVLLGRPCAKLSVDNEGASSSTQDHTQDPEGGPQHKTVSNSDFGSLATTVSVTAQPNFE